MELDTLLTSMEVSYGQRRAVMTAHALSKVNDGDDDVDNLLDEDDDDDSMGEGDDEDEAEDGEPRVDESSGEASGGNVILPPI